MNLRDSNSSKPKRTKTPFYYMYALPLPIEAFGIGVSGGKITKKRNRIFKKSDFCSIWFNLYWIL